MPNKKQVKNLDKKPGTAGGAPGGHYRQNEAVTNGNQQHSSPAASGGQMVNERRVSYSRVDVGDGKRVCMVLGGGICTGLY